MLCRHPQSFDCCGLYTRDASGPVLWQEGYKDRRLDRRDLGLGCWDPIGDDYMSFFPIQEFVETWSRQAREGGTQRTNISFPSLFNRDGFEYHSTPVFGVSGFIWSLPALVE